MKPKTDLFDLIKSMNKSEKRYFKMFASIQGGDKVYLKLFEEIDLMKYYDEDHIKKKYKEDKFVKQLTFTKNYLYNLIFKSLYNYFGKDSVESKLNDLILRSKYFYNKGLFNLFHDSITLGKKLALEYERFGYFIQFVKLEKVLIFIKALPDFDEASILKEEELIIEKIGNLSVYDSYLVTLIKYYREEGRSRDKNLFEYIERLKLSPLLRSDEYALSYLAKERFYYIHQIIADLNGDIEQMYFYCNKRLDIFLENSKPFIDTTYNCWLDILIYQILLKIRLNISDDLDTYMELLRAQADRSETDRMHVIFMESYIMIQLIIKEKRWIDTKNAVQGIELNIGKIRSSIDKNLELLLYNIIINAFLQGEDFVSALKYSNLLLNHPHLYVRKDLEYNARVLNLILHYELNNYEYLQYLIVSTYRYLYKRKKIYKLETLVLKFLKKLPDVMTKKDLIDNFEELENGIKMIYYEPHEKNIFLYFDFLKYIRIKLEKLRSER